MDYSQYTVQPQFSGGQAAKVRRMKKFLGNDHSHSSKERMRGKLTALYKQRRKARSGYDKPVYGAGSMSNKAIDDQVVSGVRSKFGNEIAAAPARQAQIKSYYDQFSAELNATRAQEAQQQQAQIQAVNDAQQARGSSEQSANSALLTQMQQEAASRGATVDPSLFVKANQASANRAGHANTQATQMGATAGAVDRSYAQQSLINRGQRQGALDKERSYTSKLTSDAADYAQTLRSQLDQASFDRGLAKATLGEKITAREQDNMLASQRIASGGSGSGGSGGSGGSDSKSGGSKFTQTQVNSNRRKYQSLRDTAKVAIRHGKLKGGAGGNAMKYVDLLIAEGTPEYLARAVVTDALYGGVNARQRKAVKKNQGFAPRLSATER